MGSPLAVLRHPLRSLKALWRGTKALLRDMRWSATRKRDQTPFGVPNVPVPEDL